MPGRLSGWDGRMARYKSYADQIVPGSFEYALNEIVEEHLDLSVFERRFADLVNPEMQPPDHWQPDACQPGHFRIEVGRAGKLL
jgi:hypothetical protein